ncbi:MAG: hypothetical protein V3T77_09100 [Planctomycetota bacterium]
MGTRADFYIGRDKDAEWLGSIAWDGYPDGNPVDLLPVDNEAEFRAGVQALLDNEETGPTKVSEGWPWPWEDSNTTDFAYAFDEGKVWTHGSGWQIASEYNGEETGDCSDFPDMTEVQQVKLGGSGSGIIIVGGTTEHE